MEKMKMSDRFITAMFLPKEYDKLLKLKMNKLISYIVCLTLLVTVIQYAIPTLGAIAGMGGIRNIILNETPDFSLKDGVFSYDEKLEKKDNDLKSYVLIDTTVDEFTKEDLPDDMVQVIMVSKSNMLVFNGATGFGNLQESKFKDMPEIVINNQSVAKMAPFIYISLFFFFGIAYFFVLGKYLFMALIYSGMVFFFVKGIMTDLTFGKTYKVAIFAQSIGAVVEAVTICIGTDLFITAGTAFSIIVSVVLMNRALMYFKMRADGVKLK